MGLSVPDGLSASPDGTRLFVASALQVPAGNGWNPRLEVCDTATRALLRSDPFPQSVRPGRLRAQSASRVFMRMTVWNSPQKIALFDSDTGAIAGRGPPRRCAGGRPDRGADVRARIESPLSPRQRHGGAHDDCDRLGRMAGRGAPDRYLPLERDGQRAALHDGRTGTLTIRTQRRPARGRWTPATCSACPSAAHRPARDPRRWTSRSHRPRPRSAARCTSGRTR